MSLPFVLSPSSTMVTKREAVPSPPMRFSRAVTAGGLVVSVAWSVMKQHPADRSHTQSKRIFFIMKRIRLLVVQVE